MESAYLLFNMWAQAVKKAGTTDVDAVRKAMIGQTVISPTGFKVTMNANHHVHQARDDRRGPQANGQFKIVYKSKPIVPNPWSPYVPDKKARSLEMNDEDHGQTRGGAREFESLRAKASCAPRSAAGSTCRTTVRPGPAGAARSGWSSAVADERWPEAPGATPLQRWRDPDLPERRARGLRARRRPPQCPRGGAPRPTTIAGSLVRRWPLTRDVICFEVEIDAPMDFEAGQFVLIERPASTALAPTRSRASRREHGA